MKLFCRYCDKSFSITEGLLSCPAGHDNFHVLAPAGLIPEFPDLPLEKSANPFLAFAGFISSSYFLKDSYHQILKLVDRGLKKIGEPGFRITSLVNDKYIEKILGLGSNSLFIKDETGNVTGSHKPRHAMGNLLYLEARKCSKKDRKDLTIYSCGNAAIGASAVVQTLGYKLYTFIPDAVDMEVTARLVYYGAKVIRVVREKAGGGDPCYNRFRQGIDRLGLIPCSCSGPDNWSNIEGGATIFYEMASQVRDLAERDLDTVIVQVGGGALASSVAYAIEMLAKAKFLHKRPRLYCVQTDSCYPLSLAFEKLKKQNIERKDVMKFAARNAGEFMKTWDRNIPKSLAEGILDDITYDWLAVIEGIIGSGGGIEVVTEDYIKKAYEISRKSGYNVSATGTAGLAGLMKLMRKGSISKGEKIGLLFTGIDRRKNIVSSDLSGNVVTLSTKDPIEKILS